MVILCELWVLNTFDLLAKRLDQRRSSSFSTIGVVGSFEASINEHNGSHILDTVITIGEVVHGLELFIDDSDASLVGTAGDVFDVRSAQASVSKLLVDILCGLNSGLGVEFGYEGQIVYREGSI